VPELLAAIAVVLVAYLLARSFRSFREARREIPRSQPIVHEFWLWTTHDKLPASQEINHRLLAANPHNQPSQPAVRLDYRQVEADVRIHIGISLRRKNPHVFEPNFFADETVVPPEAGRIMAAARSIVAVRFTSEELVADRNYLHVLTHVADALAELTQSELIYDREGMRMWPAQEWAAGMMRENARQDFDKTVQIHSVEEPDGWWLHTHGLRKYGLPDLEMTEVAREQRAVGTNVLRELAERAIQSPDALRDGEIELFGRQHRIVFTHSTRKSSHHRGLVLEAVDTTSIVDQIVYEG
jgi:hypothetical protein